MLSILRKARLKDKEMRILMLGRRGYTDGIFDDLLIIMDRYKLNICMSSRCPLPLCAVLTVLLGDVGGQKTLRSYWRNYFEKTDSLIWVVDATDRLRIDDCREELAGLLLEERLMGASLLVFLNKTDVEGCMTVNEIRELDAIKTHKWTILPCSAMTGKNLNEGLEWVVQDAKDRLFLY
ncbi:hypothetical protein T310_1798 [Rasamsonia emersonii CBS 393.64]|uniref:ADP-ribosylation factor family protein n=1 Tax=Rasamsonia emersonii (strain ATCC 16479 / CBS 393.64 / IMI 116815) TaxID=1408163 RepID=A0A0F4Z253_RASE3|nr:hypothetical protein T310_1798 [Rasamsonia emersonii CBS 393.64]KKA24146.1 hypothetical protein T310_1798 [Rasamsonia emersonii CBS 393.64]